MPQKEIAGQTYRIGTWIEFDIEASSKEEARTSAIEFLEEGNLCDADGYRLHCAHNIKDENNSKITDVTDKAQEEIDREYQNNIDAAEHERLESLNSIYI